LYSTSRWVLTSLDFKSKRCRHRNKKEKRELKVGGAPIEIAANDSFTSISIAARKKIWGQSTIFSWLALLLGLRSVCTACTSPSVHCTRVLTLLQSLMAAAARPRHQKTAGRAAPSFSFSLSVLIHAVAEAREELTRVEFEQQTRKDGDSWVFVSKLCLTSLWRQRVREKERLSP